MNWANDLVTRHGFRIEANTKDEDYNIILLREENEANWLRCRIEARLYVELDQKDKREMGRYCSLLMDCKYMQDEDGPEASFESPFTPSNIAKGRRQLSALLEKVR
jgi:hypothetical protein